MGIVRPDNDLSARPMLHQHLQCIEHVAVPQIPGFARAAIHGAIITFRRPYNARILRGETPPRTYTKDGRVISMQFASVDELMDAGVLFCGTPDEVFEQIVDFCGHCGGMGNLLMMGQGGELTHAQTVDNLTLFAREVYPRLKAWQQPDAEAAAAVAA
jgi:hypothetical protein